MWNIVLVWAGWTWMSGVAWLLYDLWYTNLVCIDGFQSELTDKLEKKWLKVIIGHDKYEPKLDDIVIYSEAVVDSPEVTKARNLAKENKKITLIISYFQFLGEISKYFITVGFAWTNGKSSTTALAIHTAKKLLPNFGLGILWALVPEFDNQSYYLNPDHKNNIRSIFDFILTWKSSDILWTHLLKSVYFFVEACEYKRHFLYLDLDYVVITSLELDHTDYYKDIKDYLSAFQQLINRTKQKVLVPKRLKNVSWSNIQEISIKKIPFTHIRGGHNNVNGSLVLALLTELWKSSGIIRQNLLSSLKTFGWLWRRLELLKTNKNGAKIFTDYGHMASSIELGYLALKKKFPGKKLFVIFQPHQINRIVIGWEDFQRTLKKYDKVMIYDIYAARENIKDFIEHHAFIKKENTRTLNDLGNHFAKICGGTYTTDFSVIIKEIEQTEKNTIIVIYSAWDIDYSLRRRLGSNTE